MRISRTRFFSILVAVLALATAAALTGAATQAEHGSNYSLSRSSQAAATSASSSGTAAATFTAAPADSAITFDHATLNDAVRMVGEPDIIFDHAGGAYVSGPGGSTTQASWFWKSDDGGVQWHLVGCPAKANCQNGGGDTEIAVAKNDDLFASDLQTLQCNSTFRSFDRGQTFLPGEGCFPETDRQWMEVYDPNGSATGRRVYLAANHANVGSGCYLLVSTDNGVTYQPPSPTTNAQGNIGASCIGRMAVDPNNGDIFVPTSGGKTYVSTNGGVTWQARGSNGAQGHFFAPIQIDTAGNLWQGWTENTKTFLSYSTDRGVTWHPKMQVSTGPNSPLGTSPDVRQVLFPWLTVGDPGRVAVVFYGTSDTGFTGDFPGTPNALWHAYATFSTNAMDASPKFTQVQADEHVMHRGAICTGGFPGCLLANSDRSMADFFMVDKDPDGRVFIAYNENSDLSEVTPGQYIGKPINEVVRLRTGPSLFASKGNLLPEGARNVAISSASPSGGTLSVQGTHGLPPGNWTDDPAGDAPFPAVPIASQNHAALDLREVSAGDDGTNLTIKLRLADLSTAALADAQSLGTPSWMVTWWLGKAGLGPTGISSGPFHSHWFVKWLGGTNFVYGKVGSVDAPALGAPTPKVLTYTPSGTATGSVTGNSVTFSVPLSALGGLAAGDKLDQVTGYTLAEHGDVSLADQVDQAKSFSYVVGTPAAKQHQADGYVQVSLDPSFSTSTLATLNSSDNTWTASLPNAPASGYVYARQVLSKELYTPLWDDVQAGPDAQLVYPTATQASISFAHPTMAGINGDGFELDLRPDPTTPSAMYAGAPGASSANTSWIWKTTDTGKTWKWVTGAAPLNGKVQSTTPSCLGGGDTEIAVDYNHHIYFNDLSGAGGVPLEFSTGRSDDGGTSFVCDTAGVPDAGVDRQWYALIGDPTLNGGDQVDQNTLYLTNDIIGNGTSGCVGGNQLVMYRSPIPSLVGAPTPNADAGRTFGPHFTITCDEGIMGNNEVSPVATKRAENGTLSLPAAVHHIFVAHDNGALNEISIGRCIPVAFGSPTPNTSDPSGLRCVDKLVANLAGGGPGARTGANFPTTAIDAAGNLYVVWEEKVGASQTLVKMSYSRDEGETWSAPITLPNNAQANTVAGKELGGPLNTNVMAWPVAGDDGRLDVAWYGSNAVGASPDTANGYYSLWLTQSLNAHDANPTFSAPILASEHFIHKGTMNTLIGNQSGDRALGDFLQVRMGPRGEAMISYADSNNAHHADTPHAMFVRQTTGASLLSSVGTVNIGGLAPDNSVTDAAGDAMYQAAGQSSTNISNLDITGSSIAKVPAGASATSACPSTAASGCYRIEMNINNMSVNSPPFPDTDRDLVWLTQWLVPSTTDALGGKNLFVYAESFAGGALQCFTGQNGEFSKFFALTYPGTVQITNPASCAATNGAGGKVVITVPLSTLVDVAGPIDGDLHEVRAATVTQAAQGNSDATGQGMLFNEIDGAQTYVFTPVQADVSVSVTDAPDPVGVGQRLAYTITASNAGPDPATGVTLADALPGGTLVSATASQGSCSGTTMVSCALGSVASGGSATVTIVLTAPTSAQTLTDTASVSTSTFDPNPDNDSSTTTTTVSATAEVAVGMTDAPDPVNVGANLTYKITVPNFGPAAATGVTVTGGIPSTVTFVSATASQGGPCTRTTSVSCPLGSIAPGDSATVTIVVAVGSNTSGGITNNAFVTSTSPDGNAANNSTTITTTVLGSISGAVNNDANGAGIGGVAVFLDTNGDGTPTAGEPTRTTGTSGGYTFTGLVAGTYRVDYAASTLPSGFRNSGTKPLTVDLAAGAAAAGKNFFATPYQADLALTKTVNPSTGHLGQPLTYTMTVTNRGPGDAKSLTLTDTWNKNAGFASVSTDGKGSCTVKPDKRLLTCTLSSLTQASGSNVWRVTLVLKPTSKPSVVNTAEVTSSNDPDTSNNKVTLTTPVTP
jgi:uncharacterized repeat protein (TIGR01451 family)